MFSSKGVGWRGNTLLSLLLAMCLSIGALFGLSGCATLDKVFGNPQGQATAKVVVQVAVFNLLTDHPEYRDPVLGITKKVGDYLDGDPGARVEAIIGLANEQIKWDKLSPRDALTVRSVLTVVEMNLRQQIDNKTLPADVQLKVRTVISWIDQVAITVPPSPQASKPMPPVGGGVAASAIPSDGVGGLLAASGESSVHRQDALAILLLTPGVSTPAFSGPLMASTEIVAPHRYVIAKLLLSPPTRKEVGDHRRIIGYGQRSGPELALA